MKITIESTAEELKEILLTIASSQEKKTTVSTDEERVRNIIFGSIHGNDKSTDHRKFSVEEGYGEKIKNPY